MRHLFIAFVISALVAGLSSSARAQGYGRGAASGYGVSPSVPYSGGSAAYLPYGTNGGGFIPYTAGPGGGLGVQGPIMPARAPATSDGMGGMAGFSRPTLGRPRAAIAPLSPISRAGASMGGGMGAGPMIQRGSAIGGMNRMARPPVGGYPFRQPPSLLVPAASAPSMSM
jgi:hypothetical protein